MQTIAKIFSVLKVIPALGLLSCVSDFSPDPQKKSSGQSVGASTSVGPHDAGATSRVSAPSDAVATSPRNESSNTTPAVKQGASGDAPDTTNRPENTENTTPTTGACDLTGRWIMTERALSSAFGAKQINLLWHYLELTQQGDSVTMKKALVCGGDTEGEPGGFAVMMDDSQAWPSYQMKTNYNGRKGTSTASGSGCKITFEESVLIRGMTPEYKDVKVALPTLEEQASGTKPGWEDWDADGQPGVTMNVSGAASGKIFTSFRTSANYSGAIAANATDFQLDYDWVQERAVFGTDPSDPITRALLASPAERAPDPGKNFVEFARLEDGQATGDDSAVCEAIRTLAHTLNAIANKI